MKKLALLILAAASFLAPSCENLTPEERRVILDLGVRAIDAHLPRAPAK